MLRVLGHGVERTPQLIGVGEGPCMQKMGDQFGSVVADRMGLADLGQARPAVHGLEQAGDAPLRVAQYRLACRAVDGRRRFTRVVADDRGKARTASRKWELPFRGAPTSAFGRAFSQDRSTGSRESDGATRRPRRAVRH